MAAVRAHSYTVDADNLEKFLAQRAELITAIKANNPAFVAATLTRLEDGSYTDVWRWESAEEMQAALAAAGGFPLAGATMSLTRDANAQNGEIIDER